jgi:hypothetical protein
MKIEVLRYRLGREPWLVGRRGVLEMNGPLLRTYGRVDEELVENLERFS